MAWVLPVLNRPENQRAIEGFHVNAAGGEPALTAPLPARGKAMGQRQTRRPAVETDRLAQKQPDHQPGEEHQMALVTDGAVLTAHSGAGHGNPRGLDWCRNSNFSHGSLPTQSAETRSIATGFADVSVSQDLAIWIEGYCNRERYRLTIGYLSSIATNSSSSLLGHSHREPPEAYPRNRGQPQIVPVQGSRRLASNFSPAEPLTAS